jgi:diacylglycerol kinase (ATP)
MSLKKIQVIVNPGAGSGRAKKIVPLLKQKFGLWQDQRIEFAFTRKQNDAEIITRNAIKEGATIIVAVGGDGTIHEIVNGFFENGIALNPECELAVINRGTGGGLARGMNLPQNPDEQIDIIFGPGNVTMDLGIVKYYNASGDQSSRLFINECQTGIGSIVASHVGKTEKLLGGPLAFGTVAAREAILIKPVRAEISYDDGSHDDARLLGLVAGNGTVCGGGMKLTPNAVFNDSLFDVLLIHDMNIAQRLLNFSRVYSGSHMRSPLFSMKRCRKLVVNTGKPWLVEADGEVLGYTPCEISVLPQSIKVKI